MLLKGRPSSRRWRNFSQASGTGRGRTSFIGSVLAAVDGGRTAGGGERRPGEPGVDDLLEADPLRGIEIAVADRIIDVPGGALGTEAFVDRPDAVLGHDL